MEQELLQTYYTNPLTNEDFPDPRIIEVKGQGYFAYATHDEFSPTLNNILVKRSMDLVHWSESKGALISPPVWGKHCQKFWCPDIARVNGEYRIYYAAAPDTKDGMCIALATSVHPLGFTDSGAPINKLPGSSYEMIDPCFFIDPVSHRHFLYYGSAHQPIRVVELADAGDSFISKPLEVLYPGEGTFHKLREAAFVTYQSTSKRYFLWVSGDNTWAEKSYAVSVFWSSSPLGMFEPIPGDHVILKPNDHWDAPGHNCVIQDAAGNDWMFYHAVDVKDRFIPGTNIFLRKMCLDRVLYTADGWPYIENSSPTFTRQKGPVVLKPAANGI
ncbi:MAG TPA: family 43 glycosylhydrolase [Chitinophagaceae bacterium]|nr:family 43 glycosylhydrolase [Chitinophagaceae bacterium]